MTSRVLGYHLGEAYLAKCAVFAAGAGTALLTLPARKVTGPALAVLFSLADRRTWGVLFLLVAAVCVWAVIRPSPRKFVLAIALVAGFQACWAAGLSMPLFLHGEANALAFIVWTDLVATAVLVLLFSRDRAHDHLTDLSGPVR